MDFTGKCKGVISPLPLPLSSSFYQKQRKASQLGRLSQGRKNPRHDTCVSLVFSRHINKHSSAVKSCNILFSDLFENSCTAKTQSFWAGSNCVLPLTGHKSMSTVPFLTCLLSFENLQQFLRVDFLSEIKQGSFPLPFKDLNWAWQLFFNTNL